MVMGNDREPALATVSGETVVSTRVLSEPVQDLKSGGRCRAVLRNPEADRYSMAIRRQELMPRMRIHSQKPVRMLLPAGAGRGMQKMTGSHTRP